MIVCKIPIYQKPVQQDGDEMWEIVKSRCIKDRYLHSWVTIIRKKGKS